MTKISSKVNFLALINALKREDNNNFKAHVGRLAVALYEWRKKPEKKGRMRRFVNEIKQTKIPFESRVWQETEYLAQYYCGKAGRNICLDYRRWNRAKNYGLKVEDVPVEWVLD